MRVAAIQPPYDPEDSKSRDRTIERALELVELAIGRGAEIVCLPEYFAVIGLSDDEPDLQAKLGDAVVERCRELATSRGALVLCPTIEVAEGRRYNTTFVLGGGASGRYRKTHLTKSERDQRRLVPGDDLPVFSYKGLPFAVASCYDMYFPEIARVLALGGARLIFFPALQRAESLDNIRLQIRARAFDNCIFVLRSAFGYPDGAIARLGMTLGGTSLADWEGNLLANLGVREGMLLHDVPIGEPPRRLRSFEGEPDDPALYLFEDRRPELYGPIVSGVPTS